MTPESAAVVVSLCRLAPHESAPTIKPCHSDSLRAHPRRETKTFSKAHCDLLQSVSCAFTNITPLYSSRSVANSELTCKSLHLFCRIPNCDRYASNYPRRDCKACQRHSRLYAHLYLELTAPKPSLTCSVQGTNAWNILPAYSGYVQKYTSAGYNPVAS